MMDAYTAIFWRIYRARLEKLDPEKSEAIRNAAKSGQPQRLCFRRNRDSKRLAGLADCLDINAVLDE